MPASNSSLASLVNPLQGTDSLFHFSSGNTLPLATRPWGMTPWIPQTRLDDPAWPFHPSDRCLYGLQVTHRPSPWMKDWGVLRLMPQTGPLHAADEERWTSFRPEDRQLSPHGISLYLRRYGMRLELEATERCARIRLKGEEHLPLRLLIDGGPHELVSVNYLPDRREVRIAASIPQFCHPDVQALYILRVDDADAKLESHGSCHALELRRPRNGEINLSFASSFISHEQAATNLRREVARQDLESLREASRRLWDELLGQLQFESPDRATERTLYSCLYRASLFPRALHETDRDGQTIHRSPYSGKVEAGSMHGDIGFWDAYRTTFPWLALTRPAHFSEMLNGWLTAFRSSGWLPSWPNPGHAPCMTGSHADVLFADAAAKGIAGIDWQTAATAVFKNATIPPDQIGVGRRGLEDYLRLGYLPVESHRQAVTVSLDYAFDDFCAAVVLEKSGRAKDAIALHQRADNWKRLFDAQSGFMRPRHADGSWLSDFDPLSWGGGYTEGSAWQHRFSVPHDPMGLAKALGGPESLARAVQEMLDTPPRFHAGGYGKEIHEMSEMAAADFGQYAHSNQPVHHVLYLPAAVGCPEITQRYVRRVCRELYSPDGFCGDEDNGEMSCWLFFSLLGFYPLCPGKSEYILGSPGLPAAQFKLESGDALTMEAKNWSPDAWRVKSVALNGQPLQGPSLRHKSIAHGGHLVFQMA